MAAPKSKPRSSGRKADDGLTPAMRQYMEQKAAAPDALLLFRMGDFYELFHEDAETAARVLGITLTSRGTDRQGRSIPLAGIPYHALEGYLTKLVRAGYKVAISEQVEDPKQARGVVRREVVRIVTAGTLTDDALLDQGADNYLACVCRQGDDWGLACVELSTGAFWVQTVGPATVLDELVRIGPAELLMPELRIDADDPLARLTGELTGSGAVIPDLLLTRRAAHLFDPYQAEQRLRKHFGVMSLAGFGFDGMDASLCAAAVVIDYLAETQKTALRHIIKLTRRDTDDFVHIDQSTWRSLEIERVLRSGSTEGSLLAVVNRTSSAMGARCLRRWLVMPLRDPAAIRERQDAVADALLNPGRLLELRADLGRLADIERIAARLGIGRASPRDLAALGMTLRRVEAIGDALDTLVEGQQLTPRELCPFLATRRAALRGQRELATFLTTALNPEAPAVLADGNVITPGHDAELDRLRAIGADGRQWLAGFQAREAQRTGIPNLKVGFNNVFGYYIEISHAHAARAPADYVRKQTIKNAERYITDELKQYETEVLTARDRALAREAELFEAIRRHAAEHIPALQALAAAVAEIDVVLGFAALADERRYVRPEIVEGDILEIADGRHPVLEQALAEKFVPNDCRLGLPPEDECGTGIPPAKKCGTGVPPVNDETHTGDSGAGVSPAKGCGTGVSPAKGHDTRLPLVNDTSPETLVILTGPNMAGKSTFIRQVALLTLLAQTGSYVPAASMRFTPVDRLFARIGASDEITRGQSTFMVEMTEAANILNNATPRSLVIIDELGRGTSTFDGLALAWAIAEHLVTSIGCRAFFATHYHELTRLAEDLPGVANYNVAVREWADDVVFLHRIVRGGTDRSYGVHVARLAGVAPDVIRRSQELLTELQTRTSINPVQETSAPEAQSPDRQASARRPRDRQLYLFADPAEEIADEIRKLDPDALTPLDALRNIAEWRQRLG